MPKQSFSPEIFIDERFSIIRDKYSWELRDYTNRAKGYCKRTWHISFTQVAQMITERMAMPIASIEELRALYATVIPRLAAALEEIAKGQTHATTKQANSMGRGDEPAAVLSGGRARRAA